MIFKQLLLEVGDVMFDAIALLTVSHNCEIANLLGVADYFSSFSCGHSYDQVYQMLLGTATFSVFVVLLHDVCSLLLKVGVVASPCRVSRRGTSIFQTLILLVWFDKS